MHRPVEMEVGREPGSAVSASGSDLATSGHTERGTLGRITRATFGYGGYDDAMMGLSLTFEGEGMGCSSFEGTWASPPSERAQWTVQDQTEHFGKAVRLLRDTLRAAKKQHVAQLVGVPVELTLDGNSLRSWRVLTEVIA